MYLHRLKEPICTRLYPVDACMLASGAADVVAALVFAVTLVGGYALCASAAGTGPQNAAIGVERGADRCPTAARTCDSPPRKTGTRWPATSHYNGSQDAMLMKL